MDKVFERFDPIGLFFINIMLGEVMDGYISLLMETIADFMDKVVK